MTIVTMPGRRMMARRCFNIGVTRCYLRLFSISPILARSQLPSGSIIMGTAGLNRVGTSTVEPCQFEEKAHAGTYVFVDFLTLHLRGQTL